MADDGTGAVLAVIAPDTSEDVKREIAQAMEAIAPRCDRSGGTQYRPD